MRSPWFMIGWWLIAGVRRFSLSLAQMFRDARHFHPGRGRATRIHPELTGHDNHQLYSKPAGFSGSFGSYLPLFPAAIESLICRVLTWSFQPVTAWRKALNRVLSSS